MDTDLCGRAAALRGKPQRLRPAVRRPDAEAAARPHRRALAGHRHRAETHGPHAAVHGGHGHGDLRLSADSGGPVGPALLPGVRRADRQAVGRRNHRQDHGPSGRHEAVRDGPAGNPRGRTLRDAVGGDAGVGLRPHARGRPDVLGRPAAGDRPSSQARRRGGDRPRDGSPRRPLADRRQRGKCPVAGHGRAPRGLSARRRVRAAVARRNAQSAFRVRPLRAEFRAALAAQFFLQQRVGVVSGVRRTGRADRHQSGGLAPRSEAHAGPRGCGALAEREQSAFCPDAGSLRPRRGHSHRRAL